MTGILLIDKPSGWTSSDVVAKLRGMLHERRIGHSGTLDPLATGLLVLFLGRATRAVEFAGNHDKRYLAGLRLGLETDTQDITGRALAGTGTAVDIGAARLEEALGRFRGEFLQVPPMYSAVKIQGEKLYEIARRGGSVERRARPVTVYSLELAGRAEEDWLLDIRCSKGTYVRTLCHDLGRALGCGGCMSSLRRLEVGDYTLAGAYTLEQVQAAADRGEAEKLLLPLDSLFAALPAVYVSAAGERSVRNGGVAAVPSGVDGPCRVYGPAGDFLALGRAENGQIQIRKSFFEV